MFGAIWNFIKRHRRKIYFAGFAFGGFMLVYEYLKWKIKEIKEKEESECLSRAKRQHHFDSSQRTCITTVTSILPNLRKEIQLGLDTNTLTEQLHSQPKNKMDLWEELKVKSFAKTIVAIYSSCLLILIVHVKLNIMSGYLYIEAITGEKDVVKDKVCATPEVQKKYLARVQYLLGEGLKHLTDSIMEAVQIHIGSVALKESLTLVDLEKKFTAIRRELETDDDPGFKDSETTPLCRFILPPDDVIGQSCQLSREDVLLEKLISETKDVVESRDFNAVLRLSLDKSFSKLLDVLAKHYKKQLANDTDIEHIQNINTLKIPTAKLIPIVNNIFSDVLIHIPNGEIPWDVPNLFIKDILFMETTKDFSANIYEAFCQCDER